MNENFTPTNTPMIDTKDPCMQQKSADSRTLDIIRQFARAYMPIAQMPGLVLN